MIYFAQATNGAIKIGATDDVEQRLKSLEVEYGTTISLLKVLPGSRAEEREYHKQFVKHRVEREWFRPEADLAEFCLATRVDMDQDSVRAMMLTAKKQRGVSIRLPDDVVEAVRLVATLEGKEIQTLLAEILRPRLREMEEDGLRRRIASRTEPPSPPAKKRRGSKGGEA